MSNIKFTTDQIKADLSDWTVKSKESKVVIGLEDNDEDNDILYNLAMDIIKQETKDIS